MKYIEWSDIYGEGEIVAVCDNDSCSNEERTEFFDSFPDFKSFQEDLKEIGWQSCRIHGFWRDFCCEKCRNEYIKNNT